MEASFQTARTFARISLGAIRHNGQVCKSVFPGKQILSVLKADAYGHGIAGVLPAYETFSDHYAVATVEEGLQIRAQSQKPVLLFGPVPEAQMIPAAQNGLTFTVGSTDYAARLARQLESAGLTACCHLKIDTGLNRSGVRWRSGNNALSAIREIHSHSCLHFTGTYTHFACGDGTESWEQEFTRLQFSRYREALSAMEAAGLPVGVRHCCATGASFEHPEYQLDMIRVGMLPMGMSYTDENVQEYHLIPAMTWISSIAQVETLLPGDAVSYGCTFRAEKPMRIGMVTCGYADGYRRVLSNKSHVLVAGKKVPVLGRVAMDYCMVDLTDAEDAKVGSEVILLGSDGVNSVTALELSQFGESVSGEITCAISGRVPRIYVD